MLPKPMIIKVYSVEDKLESRVKYLCYSKQN